jgi:hypothetical protein
MLHYVKITLLLMLYSVGVSVLMIIYITIEKLPSGDVGMLPLVIFFINLFALPITLLFTLILRMKYSIDIINTIWINNAVFLVLAIYPFYFKHGVRDVSISLAIIAFSILSSGITVAIYSSMQKVVKAFSKYF